MTVLGVGAFRGGSGLSHYLELTESQEKLSQTITELKEENQNLAGEIHRLETSASYALKILRDRYHITGENEHIIFFSDD
jgi:cell division protein FtsB